MPTTPTKPTTRQPSPHRQRPLRAATRIPADPAVDPAVGPASEPTDENRPDEDLTARGEGTGYEADEDRPDLAILLSDEPRRRGRPKAVRLIGILVVAALVLAVVELGIQHGRADRWQSQASLRTSASKAASAYGAYLSSYSYQDLTGPTSAWGQVDSHSTATFQKSFDSTKSDLESVIKDYKATASGRVTATGVESVSSSRAVVLLFINQTVTNTTQKSGSQVQPFRVAVTMLRQRGEWLINSVQTS